MSVALATIFALVLGGAADEPMKIDFGNAPGKSQDWVVLSDNVMGGVTKSTLTYTSNTAVLTGDISLKNYGGFSSIKTKFRGVDLSAYRGVNIRFKSVNQKYAFTLEDSRNWTQPNYKCKFASKTADTWEEVTLCFADFKEYVIGELTGNSMDVRVLQDIVRLGVMTDEKKEGPFSIEIDYVEFFS